MAVITRKPGRWDKIVYPPISPAPRAVYEYAKAGAWTEGKRVGFKEIAAKYGIGDVWILIFYNFQLQNPAEVNWAMNHFLGCKTTLDGKNYSFDRTDRTPKIYIPPKNFWGVTPYDDRVRDRVLETLGNSTFMSMFSFRMAKLTVTPGMFAKVADAVRSRTITCLVQTDASVPVRAMYSPTYNFMLVRDPVVYDAGLRSRIVHECLHAGMDIIKVGGNVLMHECAAHTAEAMSLALSQPDPGAVDPEAMPTAHGKAAMRLAKKIILHNRVSASDLTITETESDYVALKNALKLIPEYAARAGKDIGSNGI